MTVREIIKQYLDTNGFDGLYSADGECACLKDELCLCDENCMGCLPGYETPCNCGEHDWHISASKEPWERGET